MANRHDGMHDYNLKRGEMTTIQELDEYLNDPTNHIHQFVDNINRRVKRVDDEYKQYKYMHEKARDGYLHERNNLRREIEMLKQKQRVTASSEAELRLTIDKLQSTNKQNELEWKRKLKNLEAENDAIMTVQNEKIVQYEKDIELQKLKVKRPEEVLKRENRNFGCNDTGNLRKHTEYSHQQLVEKGNCFQVSKELKDANTEKIVNDTRKRIFEVMTVQQGAAASGELIGTNEWKETKKQLDDLETRRKPTQLKENVLHAGRMRPDSKTNIADLSDENRPTKLAERYSELCENEWIDAFEILTEDGHRTEENACQILAKAFCIIYSTCRKEADADLEVQTNAMTLLHKLDELPSEMIQNIKDRRRIYPEKYIARIEKLYGDDMKKILTAEERRCLSQFMQKSINLCWLMAIHDPPVHIDTDLTHMGELFNAKHLRQYRATGDYTDLIILPTLYLFEGGDMLCKGIVRGKRSRRISELYKNKEMIGNSNAYTRGSDKGLSEKESKRMQHTRLNEDSTATPRCNANRTNVTSNFRTSSPKKYGSKYIVHTNSNDNGNGRQPGKYVTIINT